MPDTIPAPDAVASALPIRLSIHEASVLTGLSRYVLQGMIRRGELKTFRPSPRTTTVTLDDVKRFCPPEILALMPEATDRSEVRKHLARILCRPT